MSMINQVNTTERKARPVLLVATVLFALQALTATSAFTDVVTKDVASLIVAIIAVGQLALGFYTQSKVVPMEDTGAYVNTDGEMVAGPASPPQIIDGTSVEVKKISGG